MTIFKNATTQLTAALATGLEMVGIGTQSGTDSVTMTLDELALFVGEVRDKILEGDSSVEVIDTGTGVISVTLDGTEILQWITTALKPTTTNVLDIGTSTNKIKDIHIAGGIETGTDAIGDIYYRDASGNLVALPAAAAGLVLTSGGVGVIPSYTAASGSGDSRWQTWSAATRTSDSVISSTNQLAIGTPVRFKATADTVYEYAIVTALSTNAHTIVGHSCSATLADDFEYGVPELVHTEIININGSFADGNITAGATSGLLYDDLLMKLHMIWGKADAYLVQMQTVCGTADSTTDPTIVVTKSTDNSTFTAIYTAEDVDETLHSNANEVVNTKYEILFGNNIEFTIVAGATGDAKDINIMLTFIME